VIRRGAPAAMLAVLLVIVQVGAALAAPSGGSGPGSGGDAAPIDKDLQADLKAGTVTTFVVEFAAQADLKAPAKIKDRTKRAQGVAVSLKATAKTSQAAAEALVKGTKGATATSYWLTNVLIVESDEPKTLDKLARQLSKVKGVSSVRAPKVYPLVKPVATQAAILAVAGDPEWGVEKIGGDAAWADGITGQGVVVANVDTGVDYQHEALIEQYRGNNHDGTFTHDYNWWDPTGQCGDEPCDNAAHGTHTMGTMVGGDGPGPFTPDIGVAPGAQWIAAKGCEDFFCTEQALLSSGEFILQPTDLAGENPDPSKIPDIVNNSWGSGPGDPFYLEIVQAWRTAGIIPVFSSGNPGPFCGEGGSPGDFLESFSAGATDDKDEIADFSGRGPSVYGKINPDVTAPGVDVVSSVPGGEYDAFSGTSMAAPHVSGALALMLSAEPALRGNFVAATDALRATAVDILDDSCGGDEDGDPNNVYGDGRIDAKAAVDLVATGGTLAGTITDADTDAPIAGAKVTASDGDRDLTATTDENGDYELFLAAGTYTVSAVAFGYAADGAAGVEIVTDQTTDLDLGLAALPRFDITGFVRASEDASPIQGASILALGTPVPAATTDSTGAYTLTLPIGSYAIRGSAGGCTEVEVAEGVELVDEDIQLNFDLGRKLDAFGHGCSAIAFDWADATGETALYGDEWVGRLRLPFPFTFYGETYEQVFLSDNGYLNFLDPDQFNTVPTSIPSANPPNAAIYALWRDLYLDEGSAVRYATVGSPGEQAFVVDYSDARVRGAVAPIDFQIKLHERGETVDLLFGANPANPGDGRGATIGIEDADGSDALEFSFGEGLLGPNVAYRFEPKPVATIHGTVTDANDGEPIPGATVSATPGLTTATTADDGTYLLKVYPGTYEVTISKVGYVAETTERTLADGDDVTFDAALEAGVPTLDPTELSVELPFGADPVTETVTLGNAGSAPFTWEAKERSRGTTPPVIGGEVEGHGAWRTDVRPRVELPVNGGGTKLTSPKSFVWTAAHPAADMSILIYADDPVHPAPDTFVDVALQRLGLSYTAYYDGDIFGFIDALESDSWDLVVFAGDNWFAEELFDPLNAYVEDGGRLIFHSWAIEFDPGHPLFERLGFEFGESIFDEPRPVYWWEPDHPAFTFPESAPEQTELEGGIYGIYGQRGDVLEGAQAVGGYTTPGPDEGEAALIIANEERTAFRGFLDGQNSADLDGDGTLDGVELWENLIFGIGQGFFSDQSWLSESPANGTVAAGDSQAVTVTIGDPNLTPGEYRGSVVVVTDAPKPKNVTVDVTLTVQLPESWGAISGTVVDAHSGEPLPGVTVTLHSDWEGAPYEPSSTTNGDGAFQLIGPSGTWPLEFALDGYLGETRDETIEAGTTREGVDASLHRIQPHASVEGGPFVFVLTEGRTESRTMTIGNPEGHADLHVQTGEVNLGDAADEGGGDEPGVDGRTRPTGIDLNARTTRAWRSPSVAVPPRLKAEGDVITSWPTEMELPWGVTVDGAGDVWLSDPIDVIDVRFTPDGERQQEFGLGDWVGDWGADMAFDTERGLIWQVNVGGDNGIYGIDPSDGNVVESITGSPWDGISQRGLAYDPAADVFYIGGWNEGIVYRVAGPSHPTPGETLNECEPDDPSISGLAWNASFGMLWVATNSEEDTIWLVDPITCESQAAIGHPGGGGFQGAGLELDVVGNLWTVNQGSQEAFLIESGLPTFSDVPWLTVDPTEATIAPDGETDFQVHVDTTGLQPGVHRAIVVLLTNDPDQSTVQVPVIVAVPDYQQGVDAGGGASESGDGTAYAADRAYAAGEYGYVGASSTRTTGRAIAGTTDDGLYQDQREGMTAYRFDVDEGTYRVDLRFAEIQRTKAGQRAFDVLIEGEVALYRLDLVAEAGANTAYDRTFYVTVTDGHLDIDFVAQAKGDKAVVNAILVTEIPEGIELP
jgi:subtilisin family serine protease